MKFHRTIEVVRTFVHEVDADSPEHAEDLFDREQYELVDEYMTANIRIEPVSDLSGCDYDLQPIEWIHDISDENTDSARKL